LITDAGEKHKLYLELAAKQIAIIGQYTAENGIVNAME